MTRAFVCAVAAAVVFTACAQGSSSVHENVLQHYSGRPLTLSCERLIAAKGPQAWAELETQTIHMDVSLCRQLQRPKAVEFPFAVTVLLHEAAHMRYGDTQVRFEQELRAEKTARATLKDALQRFYGFTRPQAWAAWRQVIRNPI